MVFPVVRYGCESWTIKRAGNRVRHKESDTTEQMSMQTHIEKEDRSVAAKT